MTDKMILEGGTEGMGMTRLVCEARRLAASPTESSARRRPLRERGGERGLTRGPCQTSQVSSVSSLRNGSGLSRKLRWTHIRCQ